MSTYKLFTDKTEIFECDISLSGASLSKATVRMILETPDLNLMFKGKVSKSGKCKVPIRRLKGLLDENMKGNLKLEVIADDVFFTPWESTFEIETEKKVTVEVKSQQGSLTEYHKPSMKVKRVKGKRITLTERQHVVNIMKILIKENINIKNIKIKRNKLNNIIATYQKKNPIIEDQRSKVMGGVASVLAIRK